MEGQEVKTFYVIRHVATQELMPESKGRGGYSNWVPGDPSSFENSTGTPRLFLDEASAERSVTQWVQGTREQKRGRFRDFIDGSDYEGSVWVPKDVGRKRSDVEVVLATLMLP